MFKLNFFFKVSFIVVLGTQIQIIMMRFSKLIIDSTTQGVMARSSFGRRFHDLEHFEVGLFSCSFNSL